jgi:hypothetical protein
MEVITGRQKLVAAANTNELGAEFSYSIVPIRRKRQRRSGENKDQC